MNNIKAMPFVCASLFLALMSACSAAPETEASGSSAPNPETAGVESSALTALRSEEAIADELAARASQGKLEARWQAAWSESARLRGDERAMSIIALLDAKASTPELLTLGSEPLAAYQAAFLPIAEQLNRLERSGELDAGLSGLNETLHTANAALPDNESSDERTRTFCCHRMADIYGDECVQYRTIGAWAAVKCYDGQLLSSACAGSYSSWGLPCH